MYAMASVTVSFKEPAIHNTFSFQVVVTACSSSPFDPGLHCLLRLPSAALWLIPL